MTLTLPRNISRPSTKAKVVQRGHWLADMGIDEPFFYDISFKEGGELELDDIMDELIHDDAYHLGRETREGDVWVDAGCHVGMFSIAAMMAGADVSVMIDMDPEIAWYGGLNASSFFHQQIIRSDYGRKRIAPTAFAEEITSAETLVEASRLTGMHLDGQGRTCLKLDIQGAETSVFANGGMSDLAAAYDLMVLEWHDVGNSVAMMEGLEESGWTITAYDSHTDVLLNTDTRIVWVTSG